MSSLLLIVVTCVVSAGLASVTTFRAAPRLIARLPLPERLAFARKVSALVQARKEHSQ